jgi:hypothetical protein
MIVPASILAGVGMAVVMYFPWLRPTPSKVGLVVAEDVV